MRMMVIRVMQSGGGIKRNHDVTAWRHVVTACRHAVTACRHVVS